VDTANKLAAGGLTVKVRSTDETGQMLLAMQKMAHSIRSMVGQVITATSQLTGAAHEIAVVTKQTAVNLEIQKDDLNLASVALSVLLLLI